MKLKKIIIIIFIIFNNSIIFSQSFNSDYIGFYELNFKRSDETKSSEEFILLMDKRKNKSVFLSSTIYVMDSIKRTQPDHMMYGSEFPEIVISENKKFNIFEDIIDDKYSYIEDNKLKWEILEETKKIGKLDTQLAKCIAYGRTWYAWFCNDMPYNFGPYKFNGLPGFIVSMYDAEKNLTFTLKKFKKKTLKFDIPKENNYKKIEKNKFYKTRFKILTVHDFIIFKDTKEKKDWHDKLRKRYRDKPMLDIEFPQE